MEYKFNGKISLEDFILFQKFYLKRNVFGGWKNIIKYDKIDMEDGIKDNKYFWIIVICFLLSGCLFRPCNTTLSIKNEGDNGKIILIDWDKNYYHYEIENSEIKFFNKKTMKNIVYVFIRTETMEGIFELREYDHWFPANHNIEIVIGIDEFNFEPDRKNIYNDYSYNTYIKDEKEVDFEIRKKERYSEIYDIIKVME